MITRIEIDGFKSLMDFELEVPTFLVIMGENASGKSNLVDALRSLSDTVRGVDSFRVGASHSRDIPVSRGIPVELFHQFEDGTRVESLRIAVRCRSSWKGDSTLDWHAERRVRYDAAASRIDAGRLDVYPHGTEAVLPVSAATAELDSWVPLNLVPQLMRERGLITDDRRLQADGGNVAAVLGRIAEAGTQAWQEFLADAVALLPELRDLRVERAREYWDLEVKSRGNGWMSVRTASDGTLRVLGILAAMHDPIGPSVVILDEVENGLHPTRMAELIRRLRAISYASLERGPARQLILTTHSPVVLSALYPEHATDIVFLSTAYGPRVVEGRKVGSIRTVVTPSEGAGLPRALARYVLGTVKPLEPR